MRYLFLLLLFFFISCSNSNNNSKNSASNETPSVNIDFKKIKKRGKLKAITTYSGTTYFLYKGRTMGFEYEILKRLCDHLELDLEMVIARDENDLIKMLQRGDGDIIAYGYTILEERQKKIQFTEPLYLSNQVLVQRKPENWRKMKLHQIKEQMITDPIQLIGDTVSVKVNSSYASRLKNLNDELGGKIYIDTIPGTFTTEEIIEKVAEGDIKYTVVDQNIGYINASYYPILDVSTKISFSQQIAWGVRKNSPVLLSKINEWIKDFTKTVDYHVIYNKYYKNKRRYKARVRSEFYSLSDNKISPYDDIIKKYAKKIGWDWRLVASVAYQESQFKPKSESWAGAQGLMQIMPATAEELNITDPSDPYESIRGGSAYLKQVWRKHEDITDSIQRIKFTLASYNCGYAHLKDAQRLAKRQNLNPEIWDNNVELAILDLANPEYYNSKGIRYGYVRGTEPYNYVRQIFERYDHYKAFITK